MSEEDKGQFSKVSAKVHEILHGYEIHNSTIQPEFLSKKALANLKDQKYLGEDSSKTPLLGNSCRCLDECEEETCCEKEIGVTKK